MANNNRNNRVEIKGSEQFLDQLKMETAQELGIANYDDIDKGWLPSRVNGKVGGVMVRKMIKFAEAAMQDPQNLQKIENIQGANEEDKETVAQGLQGAQMFFDYKNGQITAEPQQNVIQ
jgi:hypothetical protein